MTATPHWTAAVSAVAIAVAAILGAVIAWNLWRTNRDLLRERLYDRRFEIFEAAQTLITEIAEQDGLTWASARRFTDLAQRARFMFSTEDAQYFELLRSKALDLAQITSLTDTKLRSQAKEEHEEQQQLCAWFNDQVEELYLRMNKYLMFEK